jgi:hypothetical protein
LLRVGDLLIPGDGTLPSFSASGCAREVDRALACVNEADRQGLAMVLGIFRVAPAWSLRGLFALAERPRGLGTLGAAVRLLWIGIKGVVMTLYYSDLGQGSAVLESIGWDAKVVERDDIA